MKYKILFTIFMTFCLVIGQDYIWPTSTGKQLTSNFGEFREDHFHMGLDIRTNQSTGHPLYAVNNGYIYRITTNFKGYGKALYLKTSDDKIALYGHLIKYTKPLENKLYELQNNNQSYFVNKYFLPNEYPVKRGDIIGYSGNSGGSMGPHLHFEIRNVHDQPLNPLTNGFPVNDTTPPIFLDLTVLPIDVYSMINGSAISKTYLPIQISPNEFYLKDTVFVGGTITIAARVVDKITNATYAYQIDQIQLLVDSIPLFSIKYDSLDFNEARYVSSVIGQPTNFPYSDDFQKLYRLENYPRLSIHTDEQNGILDLSEGLHKIEIVASDASQNRSILSFYIMSLKDTVQFDLRHRLITKDISKFKTNSEILLPNMAVLENGVVFQLNADYNGDRDIYAFIEKPDTVLTFPLKYDNDTYTSVLLNPIVFDECINSGFLFFSDSTTKYDFVFKPELILPDSNIIVFSEDSLVTVEINNSYFDTTLCWIAERSSRFHSYREHRKSKVYEIFPKGIPINNDIKISFNVEDHVNLANYAIYRFDGEKAKWKYVESKIDSNLISAKLNKSEIIAVFEDYQLPWIELTYPQPDRIYSSDSLTELKIIVDDNLSGIDYSEENLQVHLDETRLWVAYQPYEKEISYSFQKLLPIDEHNLRINIQDRSGNSISKSFKFFIE